MLWLWRRSPYVASGKGEAAVAMDIFKASERLMSMDDDVWARHANPWSVWTRFTCLPLLTLAIWSRAWIGWWSLVPIALAALWTWYNPRAFSPPASTDSWASKGTFGERIYLNRKTVPIPEHHDRAAKILTAFSAVGMILLIYGLVVLGPAATILGLTVTIGGKVWFVDRMVWLYEEQSCLKPTIPEDPKA